MASKRNQIIASQASWLLRSDTVTCALTKQGGHLGPVVLFPDSEKSIQPYHVSPWQGEALQPDEPVLRMLRGDFFCFPFGASPPWRGETHRVHGETAYATWKQPRWSSKGGVHQFNAKMESRVRPGHVTKRLWLRDGESVIYTQHELSGFRGRMPLGHHATLSPPALGQLRISTSPIQFGSTVPRNALQTQEQEYYALAPKARFRNLNRVPTIWKDEPFADCSVFPAREGFVDIVSLYAKKTTSPVWTCAVASEAGYLWFALKDPAVLPTTTIWMENRGRHGPPWNGRNCCIGLEDVCAYHAEGIKASAQRNDLNDNGIPTSLLLNPKRPTCINYIQGVARIPRSFDRARKARFDNRGVTFVADSGDEVEISVCHSFLRDGRLT